MKWKDNVWPVFGLHAGMNLWWEVFAVDDTALGGWVSNGARLATIIIAVLLTIYKDKIWKPLPSEVVDVEAEATQSQTTPHDLRSVVT